MEGWGNVPVRAWSRCAGCLLERSLTSSSDASKKGKAWKKRRARVLCNVVPAAMGTAGEVKAAGARGRCYRARFRASTARRDRAAGTAGGRNSGCFEKTNSRRSVFTNNVLHRIRRKHLSLCSVNINYFTISQTSATFSSPFKDTLGRHGVSVYQSYARMPSQSNVLFTLC